MENSKNIEINHITYNTGHKMKFCPKKKVTQNGNLEVYRKFKKIASNSKVIDDVMIFVWRDYLISISSISQGIYKILICLGSSKLSANIFYENQLVTLLLPDSIISSKMADVAQVEQLIVCYLHFNPRRDLKHLNPEKKAEDIPEILDDYFKMFWGTFIKKTA